MGYAAAGVFTFVPVLIFVTGLIIALVRRSKHPRRSTFAAIGFAILTVGGLLQTVWSVAAPQLTLKFGWSISRFAAFSAVFGVVELLLVIGAWVLLLLALFFADREATPPYAPMPAPATRPLPPQQPPFPGQRPPGY